MISPVEFVEKALKHERVERLPRGELFISQAFMDRYCPGQTGDPAGQLEMISRSLGLDVVGADLNGPEALPLLSEGGYRRLANSFSVACMNGPFSRLVARLGFQKALIGLMKERSIFEDAALSMTAEAEKMMPLIRDNGFSAVALTDDISGSNGLLFSPGIFDGLFLPSCRPLLELVRSYGLYAFFHSDGDTKSIIASLARAGFDCIHPVDAQAGMDLDELREKWGRAVCLMGHVDIMAWPPEKIRKEVTRAEKGCHDGGLILGSSCGISYESAGEGLAALYPGWLSRLSALSLEGMG